MKPTTTPTRIQHRRLALLRLDRFELFDAWMDAEQDASFALAWWRDADHDAKAGAHAAYLAALDREAHAADVLRQRLELERHAPAPAAAA